MSKLCEAVAVEGDNISLILDLCLQTSTFNSTVSCLIPRVTSYERLAYNSFSTTICLYRLNVQSHACLMFIKSTHWLFPFGLDYLPSYSALVDIMSMKRSTMLI